MQSLLKVLIQQLRKNKNPITSLLVSRIRAIQSDVNQLYQELRDQDIPIEKGITQWKGLAGQLIKIDTQLSRAGIDIEVGEDTSLRTYLENHLAPLLVSLETQIPPKEDEFGSFDDAFSEFSASTVTQTKPASPPKDEDREALMSLIRLMEQGAHAVAFTSSIMQELPQTPTSKAAATANMTIADLSAQMEANMQRTTWASIQPEVHGIFNEANQAIASFIINSETTNQSIEGIRIDFQALYNRLNTGSISATEAISEWIGLVYLIDIYKNSIPQTPRAMGTFAIRTELNTLLSQLGRRLKQQLATLAAS